MFFVSGLKYIIKKLMLVCQPILFFVFFVIFKVFCRRPSQIEWVVGVGEAGGNIDKISQILPSTYTATLYRNPYYPDLSYDFSITLTHRWVRYLKILFVGPIIFAYLVNKATGFWYAGAAGFFVNRKQELYFLKKMNKKIVCLFYGSEIRSPKKVLEFFRSRDEDCYVDYIACENSYYLSQGNENEKRKLAATADRFADVVFSYSVDQMSYIKKKQYPWPCIYSINFLGKNNEKFQDGVVIKVLHAPTNVLFKGTALVRAAIKQLTEQGYKFQYVELVNKTNAEILAELQTTHIVLNQFYAMIPGILGIEGMANHCAVLQSADPDLEPGLPQSGKSAWLVTRYWEIYDHLKYLLDNPEKIKYFADNGYSFVKRKYSLESAGQYVQKVFKEAGVI